MSRRAFYVVPVIVIVIVAVLLAAGGFALLRWVWSQGYAAGGLAAAGKELPPVAVHPVRPYGTRGFFCLPTLLFIFGGLALLGMIGKWVHMWTWHRAWRRHGRRAMWWGPGGRRWPHGHVPPWYWEWPEEPPAEPAPEGDDADAGAAGNA